MFAFSAKHTFLLFSRSINTSSLSKVKLTLKTVNKYPVTTAGATPINMINSSISHIGQSPAGVDSFDKLERKAYHLLSSKTSPLDKYMFLNSIRNSNPNLFFSLTINHLTEIAPVIYTPTIGDVCLDYSDLYPFLVENNKPNGLYISLDKIDQLDTTLQQYKKSFCQGEYAPEIAVITDGSRILGLGDLGVNGMGIPIGKLQLYVAGAGLDPKKCLPIVLDLGTNNQTYLKDPNYLGLRRQRLPDDEYYNVIEKILRTINGTFPGMFIQFEDFSTDHAFKILEDYRNKLMCFNDDIQGTGAVIMSGFANAIKLSGTDPKNHRILFSGAGSAGVGVAGNLVDYFVIAHGIPRDQARKMFWFVDSKGLITNNRGDKLAAHKVQFARDDNGSTQYKTLADALEYVKPTALIGLSTIKDQFSASVISRMTQINTNSRPIIFALSNPMTKAECTFESAMINSQNKVLFASGTGFPPFKIAETGEVRYPGQGNNMYIFPALGLAAVLSKPKTVTDTMVYAISCALASSLNSQETAASNLYPELTRLREVSAQLTAAMIHQAVVEGQAQSQYWIDVVKSSPGYKAHSATGKPDGYFSEDVVKHVTKHMWNPSTIASPSFIQDKSNL